MDKYAHQNYPRLSWSELQKRVRDQEPFEALSPMATALFRITNYEPLVCTAPHAGSRVREELFSKMEIEVYKEAARRKLHIIRYPFKLPGSYCSADKLNAYVIAPNGLIFKCWHEVTMEPDRAIGSLLDEPEPYHKYNEDYWLKWDPLEKSGCRSCDVLPMCNGGCPLEALKHPGRDRGACEHYKYHLEPLLELRYQAQLEGDDTDSGPIAKGGGG